MTMNIQPLADRVLITPAPAEEKIGGIIIPDTAKEKPLQGTVVAVGEGKKDEEMVLKAGDNVLYGKYAGQEIEYMCCVVLQFLKEIATPLFGSGECGFYIALMR